MMECQVIGIGFSLGINEVDVEGVRMNLPHIQGCILLQALLQLSLTITLCFTKIEHKPILSAIKPFWDVAPLLVWVCRNCTFLEIRLRAWAYLTSMLLVLAASSLRMEYMSEIASRPDRWRSSEYKEYLDICISRNASSTSLWATVSENLSLAKACDKQVTSCSGHNSYRRKGQHIWGLLTIEMRSMLRSVLIVV